MNMKKIKNILYTFLIFLIILFIRILWKVEHPSMSLLHNDSLSLYDNVETIIEKEDLLLIDEFLSYHQLYKIKENPDVYINGIDFKVSYDMRPDWGINKVTYRRKYNEKLYNKLKYFLSFKYGIPYMNEKYKIAWNIGESNSLFIAVLEKDEEYLFLTMETRYMVK